MKRIWIYGILLAAALAAPTERNDLEKLHPVEVVSLYMEEIQIVVETDTGAKGKGETVEQALRNMKETTAGIVFLDTADYLLVSRETEELIADVRPYLKAGARVCKTQGSVKVEEAAAFLANHTPEIILGKWEKGKKLAVLSIKDDRMILNEK